MGAGLLCSRKSVLNTRNEEEEEGERTGGGSENRTEEAQLQLTSTEVLAGRRPLKPVLTSGQ